MHSEETRYYVSEGYLFIVRGTDRRPEDYRAFYKLRNHWSEHKCMYKWCNWKHWDNNFLKTTEAGAVKLLLGVPDAQ